MRHTGLRRACLPFSPSGPEKFWSGILVLLAATEVLRALQPSCLFFHEETTTSESEGSSPNKPGARPRHPSATLSQTPGRTRSKSGATANLAVRLHRKRMRCRGGDFKTGRGRLHGIWLVADANPSFLVRPRRAGRPDFYYYTPHFADPRLPTFCRDGCLFPFQHILSRTRLRRL